MGSALSSLSTEEIAATVRDIGKAFTKYEQAVIDLKVTGSLLLKLSEKGLADCYEDMGVRSEIHRIRIKDEFEQKFPSSPPPNYSDSSNSSLPHPPKSVDPKVADSSLCGGGGFERRLIDLTTNATFQDNYFDFRGVKLSLLQAVRDYAKTLHPDKNHWSFGRVSALIIGNHEILESDCRWGDNIDPITTLTFAGDAYSSRSLIDTLKRENFSVDDRHPYLDLCYQESVGDVANIFLSFSYDDNFFELVEALEQLSIEKPLRFHRDEALYSFDMLINNHWPTPRTKPSHWWRATFRDAIRNIGHTLCFISSWNNSTFVKNAWCLYEIKWSPNVTILLSPNQSVDFKSALRRDANMVQEVFDQIDLEQATCRKDEDRIQIFAAVRSLPGGFVDFNAKIISGHLCDWINSSIRAIEREKRIRNGVDDGILSMERIQQLYKKGAALFTQGRLDEARPIYERVLAAKEGLLGHYHKETLNSVTDLSLLLQLMGRYDDAKLLCEKAIRAYEFIMGPDCTDTLIYINHLGALYLQQGLLSQAKPLFERAIKLSDTVLGLEHPDTLASVNNLGLLLSKQGLNDEAKPLFERVLSGRERILSLDHPDTLLSANNLATLLYRQKLYDEAKPLIERVMKGSERLFGYDHQLTVQSRSNLASLMKKIAKKSNLNIRK